VRRIQTYKYKGLVRINALFYLHVVNETLNIYMNIYIYSIDCYGFENDCDKGRNL
jgi:hypothetical protein